MTADQGGVTHPHSLHIGDGVEGTRSSFEGDLQVPGPDLLPRGLRRSDPGEQEKQDGRED